MGSSDEWTLASMLTSLGRVIEAEPTTLDQNKGGIDVNDRREKARRRWNIGRLGRPPTEILLNREPVFFSSADAGALRPLAMPPPPAMARQIQKSTGVFGGVIPAFGPHE